MWTIIIPLIAGYVLAAKKPALVARLPVNILTNISLVLLLTVMGARIGADSEVVGQITRIGLQAFVLAWATVIGSVLILYLLQFWLRRRLQVEPGDSQPESATGSSYGLTIMLLCSVALGIGLGILVIPETVLPVLTTLTTWVLSLLLLAIGLDLGLAAGVFGSLKRLGARIILIPAGIIVGSIVGAVAAVALWNILAWNEAAALASGFGWYSLSSVLIAELHSPLLGAMAFIMNVFRELIAIVFTPLVARLFGPIPSLGPAGATAMDVLLPVIAKGTGREYVPLAFFSGAVLSLSVALFINIFMGF
ncbi:MAG: lysine exporter LysO family protein [Firmicutes bacterium]|nr:lysine exporter LysO family protein [Bacillota bacterium]